VDRIDCLNALDLHDHRILYDQIDAIPQVDPLALVNDRQSDLTSDIEAVFSKFVHKAHPIGTLEQPRAESRMNFHGRADDPSGDVVNWWSDLLRCRSHEQCVYHTSVAFLCDLCVRVADFVVFVPLRESWIEKPQPQRTPSYTEVFHRDETRRS